MEVSANRRNVFTIHPDVGEIKNSFKEYRNFVLIDKRELVFKNESGSLVLKQDVSDELSYNGYLVLEKGKQIYLIGGFYVYFSYDGGTTWYLYPLPLEERNHSYRFLEINEQNELSHFSDEWINEEGTKIRKIFHKFIPDKQD